MTHKILASNQQIRRKNRVSDENCGTFHDANVQHSAQPATTESTPTPNTRINRHRLKTKLLLAEGLAWTTRASRNNVRNVSFKDKPQWYMVWNHQTIKQESSRIKIFSRTKTVSGFLEWNFWWQAKKFL